MKTFYWHDYETFGINPRSDRPAQFAGLRTDADLNPVGAPLTLYCQPSNDFIPSPESCLITGITPQQALAQGVPEWQFIAQILAELAQPGTCGVGYNSLRFDDEVTRFTLWRNFFDPYAREWQNGCSRWDLIDLVRATYALRPQGIQWPEREAGVPSFRLEDLAAANQLQQARAHDALSDVQTTIALARLVKNRQPKLWDYALNLSNKKQVQLLLDNARGGPLLHISSRVGAAQGNLTLWLPLMPHPVNKNAVIGYDLRHDPTPLLELEAAEIAEHLYTRKEDLPEGVQRVYLKSVHINKSPFLAPLTVLDAAARERCQLDVSLCQAHAKVLTEHLDLIRAKLRELYSAPSQEFGDDADSALYAGFVGNADRRLCEQVRGMSVDDFAAETVIFEDDRLNDLLLRFRARHFPDSLNAAERDEWENWREQKLRYAPDSGFNLTALTAQLAQLRSSGQGDEAIWASLEEWGRRLQASLPPA